MQLRPYQLEDVERIKNANCIGILSEQRTGKTPTTIVGLWEKGIRRPLIVCPESLKYAWYEEYTKWCPGTATVVDSTKFDLHNWTDGALIINYEKLRDTTKTKGMWEALLKSKPDAVVLDEAHRIKTRPSKTNKAFTTRACFKLKTIPVRIALTGTPAPNKAEEVFNILHFLYPNQFSSYWRFIEDYFEQRSIWTPNGTATDIVGIDPKKEDVFQQNMDILCIQHKRKDVMTWLSEVTEPTIIKLPCTPRQKDYISHLEDYFETEHIMTKGVLDNLVRIRQICAAPALVGLKGPSPKLIWLKQYVKDNPDKSILVFSNSKKFLELIHKELGVSSIVSGDVGAEHRQQIVHNFQNQICKLLLIQTQAGKEGLTLDQADVTIFLDTYPPAADYSQAKDRMVATTPERNKPKEIIHVMMADTYDEYLYTLVDNNINATAVINDYIDYINKKKGSGCDSN